MPQLVRVFPRRTRATPADRFAYVGPPTLFAAGDLVDAARIHISVTFSADLRTADQLAREWARIAPVEIGGPAIEPPRGPFVPGRYLRAGYIMTSRGCPNRCWFCRVWRQTPEVEELPITEGHRVQDDNLLACSEAHVRDVFAMLGRQRARVEFPGGLDPARLADWVVDLLVALRPQPVIFLAYDTPADYEPLRVAAGKLLLAGLSTKGHRLRCYVLIGFPGDTLAAARRRLDQTLHLGLTPFAMLYDDDDGRAKPRLDWQRFQRHWARPALIHTKH